MKPAIYIPDFISTLDLAAIKRDRRKLCALRGEMATLAEAIQEREDQIIGAIEVGVPVDGNAEVLTRRRQNVSWLTVFKRELGERAVEQVKNEWPISFYKALQIA